VSNDPILREGRSGLRVALIFGVVAATLEMAVLLWLLYC
jgi:hypothetical protein